MAGSIPGSPTQQWIFSMVVVAGVGMVAMQQMREPEAVEPVEIITAPLAEVEPILPAIIEPPVAEVVRIDGDIATIAGTGNPGEEIFIMNGTEELSRTKVAADGTFAMVFDYAVPETGAMLDVMETNGNGEVVGAENAIAILPKVGAEPELAKLEGDVIKVEVDNREELTFAGMVYGDGDAAVISGNATPNTKLNVTLNGEASGATDVGSDGIWSVSLENLAVGKHTLGLSTDDGQSFIVPVERAAIEIVQKISRGDTLWRIAELKLGDGSRYTDIYNLNADKIKDPDLIFPDQDLIIPNE